MADDQDAAVIARAHGGDAIGRASRGVRVENPQKSPGLGRISRRAGARTLLYMTYRAREESHENGSRLHEPSVVLPLFAMLTAIAVPVALAVLSGVGGGIVAVAFGVLATLGILYGLTRFMMIIMGGET